ncbi:MAG: hypothetical protein ACIAQU_04230 [Phycisphaerales bacterium JB064]
MPEEHSDSHKVRYETRRKAKRAARLASKRFGKRMHVYEKGGLWHLTSRRRDECERAVALGRRRFEIYRMFYYGVPEADEERVYLELVGVEKELAGLLGMSVDDLIDETRSQ